MPVALYPQKQHPLFLSAWVACMMERCAVFGVVALGVGVGVGVVSGKMKEKKDTGDQGGKCHRRERQRAYYRRLCGAELSGSSA